MTGPPHCKGASAFIWQCFWEVYGPVRVWSALAERWEAGEVLSASLMQRGQWTWASWQVTEGCVTSGAAAVVLGS